MATRCAMYAMYYDRLEKEELCYLLPDLCEAIVFRCLTNPEPDPEPNTEPEPEMEVYDQCQYWLYGRGDDPEAEPKCVSPFDAAVQFTEELGNDATVMFSPILALAWAYIYAFNMHHDRKLRVPTLALTADDYFYAITRNKCLAFNDGISWYITFRSLINKAHGDTWLEDVGFEIYRDYIERRVSPEVNEP